jgi:hypothetical protein
MERLGFAVVHAPTALRLVSLFDALRAVPESVATKDVVGLADDEAEIQVSWPGPSRAGSSRTCSTATRTRRSVRLCRTPLVTPYNRRRRRRSCRSLKHVRRQHRRSIVLPVRGLWRELRRLRRVVRHAVGVPVRSPNHSAHYHGPSAPTAQRRRQRDWRHRRQLREPCEGGESCVRDLGL